jgi:hypothetical protein
MRTYTVHDPEFDEPVTFKGWDQDFRQWHKVKHVLVIRDEDVTECFACDDEQIPLSFLHYLKAFKPQAILVGIFNKKMLR